MSKTNQTHAGPGRPKSRQAQKSPQPINDQYAPPAGWVIDHHSPEVFVLRCIEEGPINWVSDREDAYELQNKRGLAGKPTGVIPVSQVESDLPDLGQFVRLSYLSKQTGNQQRVSGPVIGVRHNQPAVEIDDRERSDGKGRLVIVDFSDDGTARRARSRTQHNSTVLGPVEQFDASPIVTDGGES